jgi:hypothetical protein
VSNNPLIEVKDLIYCTKLTELCIKDILSPNDNLDFQYDNRHKITQYIEKIKAYYEKLELEEKLDNSLLVKEHIKKIKL